MRSAEVEPLLAAMTQAVTQAADSVVRACASIDTLAADLVEARAALRDAGHVEVPVFVEASEPMIMVGHSGGLHGTPRDIGQAVAAALGMSGPARAIRPVISCCYHDDCLLDPLAAHAGADPSRAVTHCSCEACLRSASSTSPESACGPCSTCSGTATSRPTT